MSDWNDTRETIVKLLQNIGGRSEVDQYLRHYCGVESQKFAVIKIGGGILEDALEGVASSLSFLHRVGLYPIVVHGASPRLQRALAAEGLSLTGDDGEPRVSAAALAVVRRVYREESLLLVEALQAQGCAALSLPADLLRAEPVDALHGLRGASPSVDPAPVTSAIRSGQLPIVHSLAVSNSGQQLYIDGDDTVAALALHFQPHKVIVLTRREGFRDASGEILPAVNLAEDYERIMQAERTAPEARDFLAAARALLQGLPPGSSMSVTSPQHLARELFTHRGAGTLIQRGERVLCHERFAAIDRPRLRELLESCFGRQLDADYFTKKDCFRVYLTERYRATAIVTREAGIPYLDKFAVTTKAQGEGLGGSLWGRMRAETPQLFWRSRTSNRANGWYFQQADGSYKTPEWTVFWYGLPDFLAIERCVTAALALPASLTD